MDQKLIIPDVRDCPAANYRCGSCGARAMVITGNPREVIVYHEQDCSVRLHIFAKHPALFDRIMWRLRSVSQ